MRVLLVLVSLAFVYLNHGEVIVLDNAGVNATVKGNWRISTNSTDFYGTNYLTDDGQDKKSNWTVTFSALLDSFDWYLVEVFYNSDGDDLPRDSHVPVTINAINSTTYYVDQSVNGGQWFPVGSFNDASFVEIIIGNVNTTDAVVVDAIRISDQQFACSDTETGCCVAGYEADDNGVCQNCSVGTYKNTTDSTACIPCAAGTYALSENKTTCLPCPNGTLAAAGSEGPQSCLYQCAAGNYYDETMKVCIVCPAGTYSSSGSYSCTPCADGRYSLRGASRCTSCPNGTYSNEYTGYANNCSLCPISLKPTPQKDRCTPCDLGTQLNTNTGACDVCPLGMESPSGFQCQICMVGYYADARGTTNCKEAQPGYYVPNNKSSSQLPCSPGNYSANPRQATCQMCSKGSTQSEIASTDCDPSPEGYYAPNTGMTQPKPCPPGRYTNVTGQTECLQCAPGTYTDKTGSITCLDTPPGYYSDYGADYPQPCPPGRYCNTSNCGSCTPCTSGYFSSSAASTGCSPAPPGNFVQNAGSSNYEPCPGGSYQPLSAQSSCSRCAGGTYAVNATECISCPMGTFSTTPGVGLQSCYQCSPGTFSVGSAAACSNCPPGTYASQSGSETCLRCPSDSVVTQRATKCQKCENGLVPNPSQTNCTNDVGNALISSVYSNINTIDTTATILAASIVGGFIVLAVIIVALVCLLVRKRRRLHLTTGQFSPEISPNFKSPTAPGSPDLDQGMMSPPYRLPPGRSNSDLAFTRSRSGTIQLPMGILLKNIVVGTCLGAGRFGMVFKGLWMDTTEVAMKSLKCSTNKERDEFEREASTLQSLSHRNIVQFLGIFQSDEEWYMVMEYLSEGSLEIVLHEKKDSLTIEDLIHFAKDAAAGMNYLSGTGMIHRDLALRNILVANNPGRGSKYLAKITDFGMARFLVTDYYTSKDTEIPVKWTSPEALNFGKFSIQSDVWSYGVLLWEIFTWGERPYAAMTNLEASKWVSQGNRMEKPPQCPIEIYQMMSQCWADDPAARPSFRDMYIQLNQIINGYFSGEEDAEMEIEMQDMFENYAKTPGAVHQTRKHSSATEQSEASGNMSG